LQGFFLAGRAKISLAFIGAAVLFFPLLIFLLKLINAFGKNAQVKNVFWTLFITMAGLVMTRVLDPRTAQRMVGLITGMGV
jgi:hypothetical protein